MKLIPLRGKYGLGKFALVDDGDFVWASKMKWHLTKNYKVKSSFYARNGNGKKLHQLIMNPQRGDIIDHINRNTLNCCKSNLRITDRLGNARNAGIRRDNTSKFRGVHFWKTGKKWMARIRVNNKRKFLGYFDNSRDAAIAYNNAAKIYHGTFASFNLIT